MLGWGIRGVTLGMLGLAMPLPAFADVRCATMKGDNWVNGCNADIIFTHTNCHGGAAKVRIRTESGPVYSPALAQQNHEKNCTATILSECLVDDFDAGICKLTTENPYLE